MPRHIKVAAAQMGPRNERMDREQIVRVTPLAPATRTETRR